MNIMIGTFGTHGDVADAPPARRRRLRDILVAHFDSEELRTLCFDLGVAYDDRRGEGRAAKARELVAVLERQGRITDLGTLVQQLRPHAGAGAGARSKRLSRLHIGTIRSGMVTTIR
jgi:hypothetical protein